MSAKMAIFPGMYFTARYQKLFPYVILLWKEAIKVVCTTLVVQNSTILTESVISFSSRVKRNVFFLSVEDIHSSSHSLYHLQWMFCEAPLPLFALCDSTLCLHSLLLP